MNSEFYLVIEGGKLRVYCGYGYYWRTAWAARLSSPDDLLGALWECDERNPDLHETWWDSDSVTTIVLDFDRRVLALNGAHESLMQRRIEMHRYQRTWTGWQVLWLRYGLASYLHMCGLRRQLLWATTPTAGWLREEQRDIDDGYRPVLRRFANVGPQAEDSASLCTCGDDPLRVEGDPINYTTAVSIERAGVTRCWQTPGVVDSVIYGPQEALLAGGPPREVDLPWDQVSGGIHINLDQRSIAYWSGYDDDFQPSVVDGIVREWRFSAIPWNDRFEAHNQALGQDLFRPAFTEYDGAYELMALGREDLLPDVDRLPPVPVVPPMIPAFHRDTDDASGAYA